jgi:DNA-binding CsgD family transcriptional regulator
MVAAVESTAKLTRALKQAPFVGRKQELEVLRRLLSDASSGVGSLAVVVGEPGIGKTALCEQFMIEAKALGGQTLIGHCYEEASLSLPYQPFVEALRSYVTALEQQALRAELGTSAADLARLVPELRARLGIKLPPATDPEVERGRLLQTVATVIRNIGDKRPLVLVLEDIHWADQGTLDLLIYLSRNLPRSRLLVVATYRDIELSRLNPLSAMLVQLRRSASLASGSRQGFSRIALRGFTVEEVHAVYEAIRGDKVRWAQAEMVHGRTEGNPLFVQEILRYLVEEGVVARQGERYVYVSEQPVRSIIPEGLRDVLDRRLSRLSENTNRLLSVAAVIGRQFRFEAVKHVAGLAEDELIESIEEAMQAGVLDELSRPGSIEYRFAHALFRETLYERMSAARRLRLHQQVAHTLEALYGTRLDDHAAELAEHFSQSIDRADLARAVHYGELAAQQAVSVFAYREAASQLERTLEVQQVLDPDDKARRGHLLLALGEAMLPQGDPGLVAAGVVSDSFKLAESIGDSSLAARAALLALESLERLGGGTRGSEAYREWCQRLDRYAQPGTRQRVFADIHQGLNAIAAGQPAAVRLHLRRALEDAIDLDDDEAFFAAAGWALNNLNAPDDHDLVGALARDVLVRPREGARAANISQCLSFGGKALFDRGDRAGAEQAWSELERLGARTQDSALVIAALEIPALMAFVDGRLGEALSLQEATSVRANELGTRPYPFSTAFLRARILAYLGRPVEPFAGIMSSSFTRPILSWKAAIFSMVGRFGEAHALRQAFGDLGSAEDASSKYVLLALLESSVLASDRRTAAVLLPRLAPLADTVSAWCGASVGRVLGGAARLLGKAEEARTYYEHALAACRKVRFRPESALTRLSLAELLLKSFPEARAEALDHLDFAIGEFEEMEMQPSLERALRLRGRRRIASKQPFSAYPDGLSKQEHEVLVLIAAGKSNQQIADQLVVSVRTVERHIANVYAKTGLHTKAQATAYAHRHGLV